MVYLYDACDQISDFCHQQLLRKMRQKLSWTDRGKTVYPPPPLGSGGIINVKILKEQSKWTSNHLDHMKHLIWPLWVYLSFSSTDGLATAAWFSYMYDIM